MLRVLFSVNQHEGAHVLLACSMPRFTITGASVQQNIKDVIHWVWSYCHFLLSAWFFSRYLKWVATFCLSNNKIAFAQPVDHLFITKNTTTRTAWQGRHSFFIKLIGLSQVQQQKTNKKQNKNHETNHTRSKILFFMHLSIMQSKCFHLAVNGNNRGKCIYLSQHSLHKKIAKHVTLPFGLWKRGKPRSTTCGGKKKKKKRCRLVPPVWKNRWRGYRDFTWLRSRQARSHGDRVSH